MRAFAAWALFCVFDASRGAWFAMDTKAWHAHWVTSEWVALVLQAAVTLEALLILSSKVRNFSWKWRLFAVLALPGIGAATFAVTHDGPHRDRLFEIATNLNQLSGYGLGVVAMLACGLGAVARIVVSPRSTAHAGIVAALWLSCATGYRVYDQWYGKVLVEWAPPALMLAWAFTINRVGDEIPALDAGELERQSERARRSRARAAAR